MHNVRYNADFVERIEGDKALHAGRQKHGVHITAPKSRAFEIRRETVDIGKKRRALYPVTEMDCSIVVAERCGIVFKILVAIVAFGFYHIYFSLPMYILYG